MWDPAACAQKPVNRPGWWEEKFPLFQVLATGMQWGQRVDICPKVNFPLPLATNGARAFIDRSGCGGVGGKAATCRNSTLALLIIFRLVISGVTSIILIVLGVVNFQFQSPFASFFF